jgi:surface antigen
VLTSTKIFQHASRVTDDRFDWVSASFKAIAGPLSGPFGTDLLGRLGGALAYAAADGAFSPRAVSPAVRVLGPLFAGVTGVLDVIDGVMGFRDPDRDGWSMVSSSLRLVSGGMGIFVAVAGGVALVGGAIVSAPVLLAVGAAAGVITLGAVLIENRETVGDLLGGAGRWAAGVVRGAAETVTETANDLLSTGRDVWRSTVGVVFDGIGASIDAMWSVAEEVRNLLIIVGAPVLRPLGVTPGSGPQSTPVGGPPSTASPTPPQPSPPIVAQPQPKAGDTAGRLPPKGLDDYKAAVDLRPNGSDWAQGPPADGYADQWGKAAWNCTSWAAFRRTDLRLSVPRGDGGVMGKDPNLPPTLGAVVSSPGHVMIVEEILSPTQFRVSEMNHDRKGGFSDQRVWTKQPDGTWSCEKPYPQSGVVLKFTP